MKIFVLEDSLERIDQFRKKFKNHSVTYCDNVQVSKDIIREGSFDILFLDHDLDNRVFVSSNEENTGYQLAKWLANENIRIPQVIIHSMNPVGAENIKKEAEKFSDNVRKIPFIVLIRSL